jgi:hypothetical protein
MSFVPPKGYDRPALPPIHAANAVYALAEVQRHRGGLVAAGVIWGRVVRIREVVAAGTTQVLEVGVLVGGSGPGAFRDVKAWGEAADSFGPLLCQGFYGLLVGEWRASMRKDGRLRHWLDLWAVYEPSDDARRLGRPLGAVYDPVAASVLAED